MEFLLLGNGLSLLLFDHLRKELVILRSLFLLELECLFLSLFKESLPSQSLFGDESLDLRRLVKGLVLLFDLSSHDILPDIVLLSQSKDLSDVVGSLGSESSWLVTIGDSLDLLLSLLHDSEGNDCEVGPTDAASH